MLILQAVPIGLCKYAEEEPVYVRDLGNVWHIHNYFDDFYIGKGGLQISNNLTESWAHIVTGVSFIFRSKNYIFWADALPLTWTAFNGTNYAELNGTASLISGKYGTLTFILHYRLDWNNSYIKIMPILSANLKYTVSNVVLHCRIEDVNISGTVGNDFCSFLFNNETYTYYLPASFQHSVTNTALSLNHLFIYDNATWKFVDYVWDWNYTLNSQQYPVNVTLIGDGYNVQADFAYGNFPLQFLFSHVFWWHDPTETRYFRSEQQNINGLLAYLLGTSQTTTSKYTYGQLVSCSSAYLYPTGDAYAGFPYIYPTTPTTHYDKVNEAVADDDATYVYGASDAKTYIDRYYKTALSIGTSKIAVVDIIIRYKGAGIKVGFYIDGTLYLSSALASKTAWTTTSVRWLKNPATGSDWTQDDVNNAQLVVQALTPGGSPVACFTQVYIRVYYYTDDTVYFQFRVFKRDASGTETAITDYITFYSALISVFKDDAGTLRSTTANIPQTALASTDSIVVRVYAKIGTGLSNQRNVYTTEQLGAQSLDASTWTFYFYLKGANTGSAIYDYWYWDTSTYPSRIENFAWTPAVTKTWHDIASWSLTLLTRKWNPISTLNLTLNASTWKYIASWSCQLITSGWHTITSWIINLQSRAWLNIASWSLNMQTRLWQTITLWTIELTTGIVKVWHDIATWTTTILTRTWHTAASWILNIITYGWHTAAAWIATVETVVGKAFPFIILIGAIFIVAVSIYMLRER